MTVVVKDDYNELVFTDVIVHWEKIKPFDEDYKTQNILYYKCNLSNGQNFLVKTNSLPCDSNLWNFYDSMILKKKYKFSNRFEDFKYFYEICYN